MSHSQRHPDTLPFQIPLPPSAPSTPQKPKRQRDNDSNDPTRLPIHPQPYAHTSLDPSHHLNWRPINPLPRSAGSTTTRSLPPVQREGFASFGGGFRLGDDVGGGEFMRNELVMDHEMDDGVMVLDETGSVKSHLDGIGNNQNWDISTTRGSIIRRSDMESTSQPQYLPSSNLIPSLAYLASISDDGSQHENRNVHAGSMMKSLDYEFQSSTGFDADKEKKTDNNPPRREDDDEDRRIDPLDSTSRECPGDQDQIQTGKAIIAPSPNIQTGTASSSFNIDPISNQKMSPLTALKVTRISSDLTSKSMQQYRQQINIINTVNKDTESKSLPLAPPVNNPNKKDFIFKVPELPSRFRAPASQSPFTHPQIHTPTTTSFSRSNRITTSLNRIIQHVDRSTFGMSKTFPVLSKRGGNDGRDNMGNTGDDDEEGEKIAFDGVGDEDMGDGSEAGGGESNSQSRSGRDESGGDRGFISSTALDSMIRLRSRKGNLRSGNVIGEKKEDEMTLDKDKDHDDDAGSAEGSRSSPSSSSRVRDHIERSLEEIRQVGMEHESSSSRSRGSRNSNHRSYVRGDGAIEQDRMAFGFETSSSSSDSVQTTTSGGTTTSTTSFDSTSSSSPCHSNKNKTREQDADVDRNQDQMEMGIGSFSSLRSMSSTTTTTTSNSRSSISTDPRRSLGPHRYGDDRRMPRQGIDDEKEEMEVKSEAADVIVIDDEGEEFRLGLNLAERSSSASHLTSTTGTTGTDTTESSLASSTTPSQAKSSGSKGKVKARAAARNDDQYEARDTPGNDREQMGLGAGFGVGFDRPGGSGSTQTHIDNTRASITASDQNDFLLDAHENSGELEQKEIERPSKRTRRMAGTSRTSSFKLNGSHLQSVTQRTPRANTAQRE